MLRYVLDRLLIKKPRFRRAVVSALYGNKDLEVMLFGAELCVNSCRENGYLRASRISSWNSALRDEAPVLMNIMTLIRDGDIFLDVGANVGLYSHSVARLRQIYPRLSIVAFEPHPSTFQRLSSRKMPGVTYHNFALGRRQETLRFVDGAVSHVFTAADKANSYNIKEDTFDVKIERLDDVSLPYGPLVIKVDVEGQEASVVAGARQLFESRRVKAIYLDGFEDFALPDTLKGYGFRLLCGRSLKPVGSDAFSLLAIHSDWLPPACQ